MSFSFSFSIVAIIKTKSAAIGFLSLLLFSFFSLFLFLLSFSFVTVILELLGLERRAFWHLFTQMTANFVRLVFKISVRYQSLYHWKKIPQHECVIFICRVHVLFFFETDPELGVIPQSASWAQMVGRKRSAKELRALWRKAIMEQILLIRMERENNSLQGIFPLFWFSLCVGVLVLSKQEPGGH